MPTFSENNQEITQPKIVEKSASNLPQATYNPGSAPVGSQSIVSGYYY